MSIPVESIVSVDIVISPEFPARFGFGIATVVSTTAGLQPAVIDQYTADRIRTYSTTDEVAEDWQTTSQSYLAAQSYFSQRPRPSTLKIALRFESNTSGSLIGGTIVDPVTTLADLQSFADGAFIISIDGDEQEIESLDFTGDLSLSDVALTIELGLQAVATGGYTAAQVAYNLTSNTFVVTSGTTGATSSVSFASAPTGGSDISDLTGLSQDEGATLSAGVDGETITESLDAIEQTDSNWYGLAFTNEVRDLVQVNGEDAIEAAAAWVEARTKILFTVTNDENALILASTTDIGSVLQAGSFTRSLVMYSSSPAQYPDLSALGRAFTTNFTQPDSVITLKFKQLPGITFETISSNQYSVLRSKRINSYVDGTAIFAESTMASQFFFDEVYGVDWLTDAIQTQIFGYLVTRPTRVPYTDKGAAALEQQLIFVLDEAVRNGLVAPGTTQEGDFLSTGYRVTTIPVADINPSDKVNRHYPGLSFIALGAGAIHSVQINGVFER